MGSNFSQIGGSDKTIKVINVYHDGHFEDYSHHFKPEFLQRKRVTMSTKEIYNVDIREDKVYIGRAFALYPDTFQIIKDVEREADKIRRWNSEFPHVTILLVDGDSDAFEYIFGVHELMEDEYEESTFTNPRSRIMFDSLEESDNSEDLEIKGVAPAALAGGGCGCSGFKGKESYYMGL